MPDSTKYTTDDAPERYRDAVARTAYPRSERWEMGVMKKQRADTRKVTAVAHELKKQFTPYMFVEPGDSHKFYMQMAVAICARIDRHESEEEADADTA